MSLIQGAGVSMPLKGWLPDRTMPKALREQRGPVVPFSSALAKFIALAAPKAQAGTDYDIPNEPACFDQGDIGSCVLNATVGAVSIVLATEGLPFTMLSRLFLYGLCRQEMGTFGQDSGTYTHLAVERVGSIGVCREATWDYTDNNLFQVWPQDAYPEASDNKVTSWYSIDSTSDRLAALEAAIRSNHPVIYGSPVSSAIQSYQAGQVLTVPDANDIIGGHSTCFTGVRYINGQRVWRIRNSWGTSYGDNGHFLIDDAWASWAQLEDLWVLSRADALMF